MAFKIKDFKFVKVIVPQGRHLCFESRFFDMFPPTVVAKLGIHKIYLGAQNSLPQGRLFGMTFRVRYFVSIDSFLSGTHATLILLTIVLPAPGT